MNLANLAKNDTIIAPATAPGMGAIAVIRISGPMAYQSVAKRFKNTFKSKDLLAQASHTTHFGHIMNNDKVVDEVLIALFKEGSSYTGEETVEISCHGSTFITQELLSLFIKDGLRMADPGEFTMRAYRNGKYDLAQAEAVADLIHSTNKIGAEIALSQMRGGFSSKINELRQQLLDFASLIELELDFAEEDVEFADRTAFINLVNQIKKLLSELIKSFELGNVIKNGVPVAIVGEPNVGKSTLLNAILNDERAIVSDIAGTTRDVIEDVLKIDGLEYRFIDTAGIRETTDYVEGEGIKKTFQKITQARVVLHLLAINSYNSVASLQEEINSIYQKYYTELQGKKLIFVLNKSDEAIPEIITAFQNNQFSASECLKFQNEENNSETYTIKMLAAKNKDGVQGVLDELTGLIKKGEIESSDIIVTNIRHVGAMEEANESLTRVLEGIDLQVPSDLLAIDIRAALQSLGSITGNITTDDLLGNIFSKFCIGK